MASTQPTKAKPVIEPGTGWLTLAEVEALRQDKKNTLAKLRELRRQLEVQ
jgi:hypothetical protein